VRVAIVFAGAVVPVVGACGREFFKPLANVLNQAVFVVVDVNGGRDVHGRHEAQAVFDAAALDDLFNLIGDVHHFAALLGLEDEIFGVSLHASLHSLPIDVHHFYAKGVTAGRRSRDAHAAARRAARKSKSKIGQQQEAAVALRVRRMHDALVRAYGPQFWWPAKTPFEVILGAYLTQNTAWKAVERSLENLRAAGALTVDGLRAMPLGKLRRLIRPSGFITRKAPALKAFVALLDGEFGGSLEAMAAAPTGELRERLMNLSGVGNETADAILLYAFGHAVPVADEYLRRIAERHGLVELPAGRKRISYGDLEGLTRRAFAGDPAENRAQLFNEFHALTVAVGKAHCGKNARCEGCPLEKDLKNSFQPLAPSC